MVDKGSHENIESGFIENELYHINNMILEEKKKYLNNVSVCLNENLKYI